MDEDLRQRLSRIDPCPCAVPVHRADGQHARALLEGIMSTPVDDHTHNATTTAPPVSARRSRRWLPAALAGAAVAAAVTGVVAVGAVTRDDAKRADKAVAAAAPKTQVALKLAAAGTTVSSCIMFDVQLLAGMPVAFGGTVADISASSVVIDVDRWYRGGSADQVALSIPPENTSAALDGVDFVKGSRYLVTATGGTVNGCGFSGPATPELEAAFGQAFAA